MVDFLLGGWGDRAGAYPPAMSANHPLDRHRWRFRPASVALPGVLVVLAATVALAVERLEIVGQSMRPTLEPGDRVVVLRFVRPRVGDLVALPDPRAPGRTMVKRVAAIEGGDVTLLGDNPEASTDSRHFGPVPRDTVAGRIVYRYAPDARRGVIANSSASRSPG